MTTVCPPVIMQPGSGVISCPEKRDPSCSCTENLVPPPVIVLVAIFIVPSPPQLSVDPRKWTAPQVPSVAGIEGHGKPVAPGIDGCCGGYMKPVHAATRREPTAR